jgi:hypothetical protein
MLLKFCEITLIDYNRQFMKDKWPFDSALLQFFKSQLILYKFKYNFEMVESIAELFLWAIKENYQ